MALPLSAQTAEEVVRKLYAVHLKTSDLRKTAVQAASCFTPGFLGIIEQALKKTPGADGKFVDVDFLTQSQGGWGDFEIEHSERFCDDWVVTVKLWTGLRSAAVRTDPAQRKAWPVTRARFFLTDVGSGPQIRDLWFPAQTLDYPGIRKDKRPEFWVRHWLEGIAR